MATVRIKIEVAGDVASVADLDRLITELTGVRLLWAASPKSEEVDPSEIDQVFAYLRAPVVPADLLAR